MPDEPSALPEIFAALRPSRPETSPRWQKPPRPLGDRLRAFEERRAATETNNLAHAAGQAGERTRRALEALLEDPRSAVLARMAQAARGEAAAQAAAADARRRAGEAEGVRGSLVEMVKAGRDGARVGPPDGDRPRWGQGPSTAGKTALDGFWNRGRSPPTGRPVRSRPASP